MADEQQSPEEIKETDIVFDCPECGKSLVIDYRAAGLSVPCSDCGSLVDVPIPEGMEIADIDSTSEEQEIRILHLRKSLTAAEFRIVRLEAELGQLQKERDALQENEKKAQERFLRLRQALDAIREGLASVGERLNAVAGDAAERG